MTAFDGLSPREWWPLATEAERCGVTVRTLLAEREAAPAPVPVSRLHQLSEAVSAARAAGFRVPRRELTPEDREWRAGQRRQVNLNSFRNMTEEWTGNQSHMAGFTQVCDESGQGREIG